MTCIIKESVKMYGGDGLAASNVNIRRESYPKVGMYEVCCAIYHHFTIDHVSKRSPLCGAKVLVTMTTNGNSLPKTNML